MACRARAPQAHLVRVVARGHVAVVSRDGAGRGAWLHHPSRDETCWEPRRAMGALRHALRSPGLAVDLEALRRAVDEDRPQPDLPT